MIAFLLMLFYTSHSCNTEQAFNFILITQADKQFFWTAYKYFISICFTPSNNASRMQGL